MNSMDTRLISEYKKSIDNASGVSFDVFDTLIHRVTFRPTHVFDLLAIKLKHSDIGLLHPRLPAHFPELRVAAEREARAKHFSRFGTHEITLTDIYSLLSEKADIAPKLIADLIHEELAIEQALVYPNEQMKQVYDYAVAQGKPVVLCSDMYLLRQDIERLLTTAGYAPPFRLLVSGEIKKSKHEGNLFPYACMQLGVPQEKLVHFGDNLHADFLVPQSLGMQSHHYNVVETKTEPRLRMPPHFEFKDQAISSLIQGTIKRVLHTERGADDFWFDIGLQIFGPLFLGKFLWFIRHLRMDHPDKVLFFARDAHFHHMLYTRFGPALGIHIPAEYVYFSRASLLLPSFTELKLERIWHLFSGRSTRTVGEHLSRLGINPFLVGKEIAQAGFESLDDNAPNGDWRMFTLLKCIHPLLLDSAREQRQLVGEYVRQVAGTSRKIGIIDIGWIGNMQGSFSRLLQLTRNDFELFGYYYGTFEGVYVNHLPRNHFRSYIVHECQPRNWYDTLVNGGVELLEFAQMAPHGTTLGYQEIGDSVRPLFEENLKDRETQQLAARLQQGAMRFIETAIPVLLSLGADSFVSTTWADPFFRLVNLPTTEEADALGELTHSDSATDTNRRLPLAEKLTPKIARRKGRGYKEAYAKAYWKKAFEIRNN